MVDWVAVASLVMFGFLMGILLGLFLIRRIRNKLGKEAKKVLDEIENKQKNKYRALPLSEDNTQLSEGEEQSKREGDNKELQVNTLTPSTPIKLTDEEFGKLTPEEFNRLYAIKSFKTPIITEEPVEEDDDKEFEEYQKFMEWKKKKAKVKKVKKK